MLVEGGGTLNWSMLEQGLIQRVYAYVSPMLLGGREAKTPVGGPGFPSPDQALRLKDSQITRLGEDFLIESEVEPRVHRAC